MTTIPRTVRCPMCDARNRTKNREYFACINCREIIRIEFSVPQTVRPGSVFVGEDGTVTTPRNKPKKEPKFKILVTEEEKPPPAEPEIIYTTIVEVSKKLRMDPGKVRSILRKMGVKKPEIGWAWSQVGAAKIIEDIRQFKKHTRA